MYDMMESRTVNISIQRESCEVYAFISEAGNLPLWANTFCKSAKESENGWVIETPLGPLHMRIAARNNNGVVDHYFQTLKGPEVHVPVRVLPNGTGCEVTFTVFRYPWMTDESYKNDIALVGEDLVSLKKLMESKDRV